MTTSTETIIAALALATLAGLSTTIGSLVGVFYREPGRGFMAFALGFSAGVMIFVSFVELLAQSVDSIGFARANVAFFAGFFMMYAVDVGLPHLYILEDSSSSPNAGMHKTALLVPLGIAIHNFPEGMATLAGALQSMDTGIAMAAAVAVHNIPEGIAVAVPVYAATRSVGRAFKWSFLSGLSEPIGAVVALVVLMPFLSDAVLGWMLSIVAGFMVFISFDELLPAALSYGREHLPIMGVAGGMAVMSVSLALLNL